MAPMNPEAINPLARVTRLLWVCALALYIGAVALTIAWEIVI